MAYAIYSGKGTNSRNIGNEDITWIFQERYLLKQFSEQRFLLDRDQIQSSQFEESLSIRFKFFVIVDGVGTAFRNHFCRISRGNET